MGTLEELAALVHRESGILMREAQYDALAAALKRLDPAGDQAGFMRRAADPIAGAAHVARLLDEVTVKETFFLRDARQLEQIPWQALLDRARQRGAASVRVWSAGCATGEEAYTLALLACEAFGSTEPPVTILATDISEGALRRARKGEYRTRSTRELDPSLRRRYFREDADRLVAGEQLRALVTFARHNLVHDPLPPLGQARFDLILCRNVLIYFDSETVDRVTAALDGALVPGGTLILGAADALCRGAARPPRRTRPAQPDGGLPPRPCGASKLRIRTKPPSPPSDGRCRRPDLRGRGLPARSFLRSARRSGRRPASVRAGTQDARTGWRASQ